MPTTVSLGKETRMEGRTEAKSWFEDAGKVQGGTGRELGRYGIACGRWNGERGRWGTMRNELERTAQGMSPLAARSCYSRV